MSSLKNLNLSNLFKRRNKQGIKEGNRKEAVDKKRRKGALGLGAEVSDTEEEGANRMLKAQEEKEKSSGFKNGGRKKAAKSLADMNKEDRKKVKGIESLAKANTEFYRDHLAGDRLITSKDLKAVGAYEESKEKERKRQNKHRADFRKNQRNLIDKPLIKKGIPRVPKETKKDILKARRKAKLKELFLGKK